MSTPVQLIDGRGTKNKGCITPIGQLVVSPFSYDETTHIELATPDTAYNFYTPEPEQQFVITGFIAKADKQVSNTVDAQVVIYEGLYNDTIIVDKVLFETAMVSGDNIVATPLNILVSEGKYVNAKTSDDDIHLTIMGYYIPVI